MKTPTPLLQRRVQLAAAGLCSLAVLGGCASLPAPEGPPLRELALAVTASNKLLAFNAGQPGRITSSRAITGLQPGENVVGIDFRAPTETLYALGSSGRLYKLDPDTAAATAVGNPFPVGLKGPAMGFDFNPTVDRIRVVGGEGQNLRLHPDTGAVIDSNADTAGLQVDGTLTYAEGDANAGRTPAVAAAAYSYNKANPKVTTNFAIDAATGALVTQGTREGTTPGVSPNTGRLYTVGGLGQGPFAHASFDIHVISDAAFAALTPADGGASRWVRIDLATGKAQPLGTIGGGEPVVAVALDLV